MSPEHRRADAIRRFVLLGLLALGGCTNAPERVDISYRAGTGVAAVPGAERVDLTIVASDRRTTDRDRISAMKNGRGMDATPIAANQDVVDVVRRAVATELQQCGFRIGGGGGPTIAIEVTAFYNDFRFSYAAGDAVAAVGFTIRVERPDRGVLFERPVTGRSRIQSVQFATGDAAKRAIERALADAIGRLMTEPGFLAALVPG
jgi:uncharacterized lipoprotein YajG